MSVLFSLVAGLGAIGVLVFIHEFGHFIVAKAFKVGVPVFSIGMGPRLWGFRYGDTDYRISALPVGGYVQLAGADPFGDYDPDALVDPETDFMNKPIWQRLLVMLAGPVFNLVLPVVLFTAVLMTGDPNFDTTVGMVLSHTSAEQAGIRNGDVVTAVNGQPVEHWRELEMELANHTDSEFVLSVTREGQPIEFTFAGGSVDLIGSGIADSKSLGIVWKPLSSRVGVDDPTSPAAVAGIGTGDYIRKVDGVNVRTWEQLITALDGDEHSIEYIHPERTETGFKTHTETTTMVRGDWKPQDIDPYGDLFGLVPALMMVGEVAADSPALKAGVLPNDRILAVDGVAVHDFDHLIELVALTVSPDRTKYSKPRAVKLLLVRDGELLTLDMTPEMKSEVVMTSEQWRPIIGIAAYRDSYVDGNWVDAYYSLFEALPRAVDETTVLFTNTLDALGNLMTGGLAVKDGLGGPIAIFEMAAKGAERGMHTYARFIGMISISLGLINLLPVPVLDGGQILFYLVEGIRGRPLSVALRERLQMIGVLALVALMIVVTVNDVSKLIDRLMG